MKKVMIVLGIVVAIAALVVCLVPLKEVAYAVTVDYEDIETYYDNESLEYRELDSFTTEGSDENSLRSHASTRGYDLPDEIVAWPDFALYVLVQNLDDVSGTFEVRYTCIGTADKTAAEKYMWLHELTSEEYEELDVKCYAGAIELYLQPGELGVAICPQSGVPVGSNRVPWWSGGYDIIPGTQAVEKQRTVTRQRQDTRYKKVTLLDYLLHYR